MLKRSTWMLAAAAWGCTTAAANAACVQSGNVVTCSGTTTGGFGDGTQNGLTVQNQPGGSITPAPGGIAVWLNNNNAVINNGTLSVGDNSEGIQGFNGNSFTNNGAISLGAGATAIVATGTGNTVGNTGSISSQALQAVGIYGQGGSNTIVNSGTITLTGSGGIGIRADFTNNIISNSGLITIGNAGLGVLLADNNIFTNTGTISARGTNSDGVSLFGSGNTLTNNGTIIAARGVAINGSNETVVNNGAIIAVPNGNTITAFGTTGFSLVNNGTLDGQLLVTGTAMSLTNAGLITITDPGTLVGASQLFTGTFTQTSAGILALRVDNTGANDNFRATTANLGGTLRAVVQPGLYGASTTYSGVLLATDPLNGKFAQVTSSLEFFNAQATYHTTSVDLTLTRYGFGAVPGETQNQRSVGNALEAGYSTGLTGSAAAFYSNLLQARSGGVLDQLSGEGTSGTQNTAFLASNLFNSTLTQQMDAWRSGDRVGFADNAALNFAPEQGQGQPPAFKAIHNAPVSFTPSWHAWGAAFGATQSLKGDASTGSADLADSALGGAAGVDVLLNPDLLFGLGAGGSTSRFDVSARATSGTLDGGHVGAYAMQRWGSAYASAQLGYSRFDNSTSRTISGVGATETASGSFSSDQFGGRFEIGNTWNYWRYNITPFAAIQVSELWQRGYTETSTTLGGAPGVLALSYAPVTVQSLPASLGAQFDTKVGLGNGMVLSPYLRAAWVHEFSPARTIDATLTTLPVGPFMIDGARAASDVAKIDLGARLPLTPNVALQAAFNGEFSGSGQVYAGTGGLRVNW